MANLQNEKRAENQLDSSQEEKSSGGGLTASPPAFQLKASGAGNGGNPIQRVEDPLSENVTEGAVDHLYLREARRNVVYLDSEGFPTVGIGHLLTPAQRQQYPVGTRVSDALIEQWLRDDSQNAYSAAYQQMGQIGSEHQPLLDALCAVNFQNGTAWNTIHRGTWRYLLANQWESAAREAADSLWFQQSPVRVTDFQRVLLTMAGKPTDYDSLLTFNAANIRKWGVRFPTRQNFGAFTPEAGPVAGDSTQTNTGGETQTEGQTQTGGETQTPQNTSAAGLSGPVGLGEDGKSFVGSSADIRKVQELLISAGVLMPTRVNNAGQTVSNADGFNGNTTVTAIQQFQSSVLNMRTPDGRIDPGGRTWGELIKFEGRNPQGQEPEGNTGGETQTETQKPVEETPTAAPVAGSISGPVGLGEDGSTYVGSRQDITTVQQLLINRGMLAATRINRAGQTVSNADGFLGETTIAAIKAFQSQTLGFSRPDGRVDPDGNTWKGLTGQSTQPVEETADTSQTQQPETQQDTGSGSEVATPTTASGELTPFDQIPEAFRTRHALAGSVGNGGGNSAADIAKATTLLRMVGYRTELLVQSGSEASQRSKRRIQFANCIYNFQMRHAGLGVDARIDAGGGTWKKLVEVAFLNSGGEVMSEAGLNALNAARKGTRNDVPSDLVANITDGHLLGIDKSGYLLPEELHSHARGLKTALETIKGEIGNFSISCGYRSPEHNVKIGSTATMSQHVGGYAADIQWPRPSALKTHIIGMIRAGKIPAGGVGLYSWGVHYDTRGTLTTW